MWLSLKFYRFNTNDCILFLFHILDDADDIKWVGITNTSNSNYTGGGGGVTLRWQIPENPNGVITSFYISFKRVDIENDDGGPAICVKRKKFDDTYQEHSIKRLANGNYSFQVKAVSLAGEGKPSATIYYVIDVRKPEVTKFT